MLSMTVGTLFNVISITRGWVGIQFPGKKCYVTLEWPLMNFEKIYIGISCQNNIMIRCVYTI